MGHGINFPGFAAVEHPTGHYIYDAGKENLIYFVSEHDI